MKSIIRSKLVIALALITVLVVGVKSARLHENASFLSLVGKFYFDKEYYLSSYPEVKESGMTPYEHYMNVGWKEWKNPSESFDTKFYYDVYIKPSIEEMKYPPLVDYVKSVIALKHRAVNDKNLKKAVKLENPKYYLALAGLFQNEGRFLKEWIEFYRMIGVEHFYLHNHNSTDNYLEVLQPFIDEGIVDLIDIKKVPKTRKEWSLLQFEIFTSAAKRAAADSEWLMIVDTDEFLFPVQEKNLRPVLEKYDEYASLGVNWRIFGTSDVKRIGADELMIEKLKMAEAPGDRHVKSIVKPRYVEKYTSSHYPELKEGYLPISENYEYFYGAFLPESSMNVLRINHYWSRDYDFFESRKLKRLHIRGYGTEEEIEQRIEGVRQQNISYSQYRDTSIEKYEEELRSRVFPE